MDHLRDLRLYEAERTLEYFPRSGRILEIGAGSGWQSKMFSDLGYDVSAIDVETSQYLGQKVFPVETYDGAKIPFSEKSFDVVFSSNVLEHITDVERFQQEIARVLAPGGFAVHVLPTASWRLWSDLTYYSALPGRAFRRLKRLSAFRRAAFWRDVEEETRPESTDLYEFGEFVAAGDIPYEPAPALQQRMLRRLRLLRRLGAPTHGEKGNALSEIYYFSRYRWKPLFERAGFSVVGCHPNKLFYTGYSLFGDALPISARRRISSVLGSSCLIYVVKPV